MNGETDFTKLPSDLQVMVHAHAHTCGNTHTHKIIINIIKLVITIFNEGFRTSPKFLSLEPYIKMIMKEIQCPQ